MTFQGRQRLRGLIDNIHELYIVTTSLVFHNF